MTCHSDHEDEPRYAMERTHTPAEGGLDIPDEARFTRFECFAVHRRRQQWRRWITLGLGALLAGMLAGALASAHGEAPRPETPVTVRRCG